MQDHEKIFWFFMAVVMCFILLLFFMIFNIREKHCSNFTTQKQAQRYINKYPKLDRNHDGIACNGLPEGGD